MGDFFLENYSKRPYAQRKPMPQTIAARNISSRRSAHARLWILRGFDRALLRDRLRRRVRIKTSEGYRETTLLRATDSTSGISSPATDAECRSRKKFLLCNPCAGVEFPVVVKGLFRPTTSPGPSSCVSSLMSETTLPTRPDRYRDWSKNLQELMPMRKENCRFGPTQLSGYPTQKPPTESQRFLNTLAIQAFRRQMAIFW